MVSGVVISNRVLRAWAAVGLAAGLVACDSGPTTPTPPPPPPATLTISCPTGATGVSHLNQPAAVSWPDPVTTGGVAPMAVLCTPASGSLFSAGVTTVTCRAADSATQTASCSFPVTVTRTPQVSATRFLAFGDSITEGQQSAAPAFLVVVPMEDYPFRLNTQLSARYVDQTITVENKGKGGEWIADGLKRLPGVLSASKPEVLLLLEGANDLLNGPSSATTDYIVGKLRDMVRLAKGSGVKVMLATFPPQRQGGVPGYHGAGAPFVPELNQKITALSVSEGVYLVDLYAGFPADTTRLIGIDGLHPTSDGYLLIAQIFNQAVTSNLEVKTTSLPSSR